ncbi:MAG: acyltransferase family protein [Bacteroidia bacterium]
MTNTLTTKNPLIYSLNWLRGIASLIVCLYHLKLFIWKNESPNEFFKFLDYGHLGVVIFFIISGFVIPYSMYVKKYTISSFFSYVVKRSARIEPPYIASILLTFAWGWYCYTKMWGAEYHINWPQFFLNITYLAPFTNTEWINVIFWTLAIEFQFYILTGLIFNLLMKSRILSYLIFSCLLFLGFVTPEKYMTVFNVYIFFVIGFQCFMFYVKKIPGIEFVISLLLAVVFAGLFEQMITVPFVLFTIAGIFLLNYKSKIAQFFGDISYSLYLTHGLIGGNIIFFNKEVPAGLLFGISVLSSVVFAYIFYQVIEKPFLRLSKRLNY